MPAKLAKADITPVSGVYRIWLSDRHYYIGRSSDIAGRCSGHLKMLRKQTHPNPRMLAQAKRQERERLARQEVFP